MATDSSACEIYDCRDCTYRLAQECPGCREGNVALQSEGVRACAVYSCVESFGLDSCIDCGQSACVLRRSVETICPLRSKFENRRWWAGRISRVLESRSRVRASGSQDWISEKVVTRLRWYLRALDEFAARGDTVVSSWQLAHKVGVSASLIRKDLARFGGFGTPSSGYAIDSLTRDIRRILGLDRPRAVIWIGAAAYFQMRSALERITAHGCRVSAVFDPNPADAGGQASGIAVLGIDRIGDYIECQQVDAAVLAVPGPLAQEVALTLERSGIRALLNLTGELLILPDRVRVTTIDLAGEILELCYYSDRDR